MTPEEFEKLDEAGKQAAIEADWQQREWFWYCRKCGEKIKGSLKEARLEHVCTR